VVRASASASAAGLVAQSDVEHGVVELGQQRDDVVHVEVDKVGE
jgi:hypothetical protein